MSESANCPRCGTSLPLNSRFCNVCGSSVSGEHGSTVSAAVAREDRLSDSGAIELRNLLVAETAADYEIFEELGRGGMAVVYRAREIALERIVAIKILPPELTFAKGATERFRREAKTAAALDHPNIIPIYRISSGGRLFWYAMKYLEGRSLGDLLQEKGLLTLNEAIQILTQVAEALDYAHQRGVVHRDVKPGNVMIDSRGRVIVTDFGIAKELQGGALTGSGAILGTPYYMSPEQCRGTALTGAADQYSLGVVTYQMITGQLPFEADSAIDVIHKHVSEPPPPIEQYVPSLPRHVIAAINRAMAKKPDERFPTVAAFVAAMKNEPSEATLIMQRRASLAGAAAPAGRRSGFDKPPSLRGTVKRIVIGVPLVGALVAGSVWLATRQADGKEGARPATSTPTPGATAPASLLPESVPIPARVSDTAKLARESPAAGRASEPTRRSPAREQPRTAAAPIRADTSGTRTTSGQATEPAVAAPRPSEPMRPAGRQGYISVSVTPFANITISGPVNRSRTEARVFADSLPPGRYTVRFEREGFQAVTRQVTIRAGVQTPVVVTLQPAGQP